MSAQTAFGRLRYQWFPYLQFDLQNTFNAQRGDYLYVMNKTPSSELMWTTSPFASLSINQTLPGKGAVSLTAGYGFNYSMDYRAFLQYPQVKFTLNQYLGRGAFGITKNPEYLLMKEQTSYYSILYRRNLNSEVQNILSVIEQLDTLTAKEEFYQALANQYESGLDTAKEKNLSGLQSELQMHFASRQLSEAQNNLNQTSREKEELLKELCILLPDLDFSQVQENRTELQTIIYELYEQAEPDPQKIENNLDSALYSNILSQYLFQYQNTEIAYAPQFFISSSLSPDSSASSYYADWNKSLRIYTETKHPFDFSVTIGLQKSFEVPKAHSLRKEIYTLNKEEIEKEAEVSVQSQKNEFAILKHQIDTDILYLNKLEEELQSEKVFRQKREELYSQNLMTQDEFLQSETLYFRICCDYISTFWNILQNQMTVITMCSTEAVLLKKFIRGNYGL